MRGLIPQIWSATASEDKFIGTTSEPTNYQGKYPTNTVSTKTGTKTDIKRWQTFLNWWGHYDLDIDGSFGKLTKGATLDFQNAYGLVNDGIVGNKTNKQAQKVGASEKH